MYSPYFFGRGSELLALRAILRGGQDLSNLLPIIEPVQTNSQRLRRIMEEYAEQDQPLAVIVNPSQNEFNSVRTRTNFRAETDELFAENRCLLPAYRVHADTTRAHIDQCVAHYGRSIVLIYSSPSLGASDLRQLADSNQVIFHVVQDGRMSVEQVALLPTDKVIDVRDHFEKLARNADYHGSELFTDRHKAVGRSVRGIGDYTITGRVLELGGGPAAAVAIHASFEHPRTGDIWMEHFVSDDTDQAVGDVASKFLQAASKLVDAVDERPTEFGEDNALDCFRTHVEDQTFPGLAKNKEFQIEHHVMVMLRAVSS